jgi:hypothetical protein
VVRLAGIRVLEAKIGRQMKMQGPRKRPNEEVRIREELLSLKRKKK